MPLATVKHGKFHTGKLDEDGNKIVGSPGETVEVSDAAMENFKDQLQLVVEDAPAPAPRRGRKSDESESAEAD